MRQLAGSAPLTQDAGVLRDPTHDDATFPMRFRASAASRESFGPPEAGAEVNGFPKCQVIPGSTWRPYLDEFRTVLVELAEAA